MSVQRYGVVILVLGLLAIGPAEAHRKRHRSQGFVPAGTPWGVNPREPRVRSVTVWGAKPSFDDASQSYVLPQYGAAVPLHYSAYPYEPRRCRCARPHPDHVDPWTGYDDHDYRCLGGGNDHHHDPEFAPSR